MVKPFQRVLLPLGSKVDQNRVLLPATVLASWFDIPIQIVCDDHNDLASHQVLAGGLGTAVEPVMCLEDTFIDGLAAHAHSQAPAIIVTEPTPDGMAIARHSSQPVFLVADKLGPRMPMGPLATEITGANADLDALALSATLAQSLDEPIRLVVGTGGADSSNGSGLATPAAEARARLRQMGCDAGIDSLRAHGLHPLVLVGRTRGATAVVLPRHRLDEPGLVDRAIGQGVNIFVAQPSDDGVGRAAPFEADLGLPSAEAPAGADLQVLDRDECLARLGRHSVGRIGYVDTGWPTVVPVNYRLHAGDVFIRSLAGGKLRAAERRDTVCLEIDGYDEQLRTGWSVVAHGALEVIEDAATLRQAWGNDPDPWVASEGWQWLRMVPFSVSGRSVEPGTE